MRLNKKRLAALAMSAVMAASAVPFPVYAEELSAGEDVVVSAETTVETPEVAADNTVHAENIEFYYNSDDDFGVTYRMKGDNIDKEMKLTKEDGVTLVGKTDADCQHGSQVMLQATILSETKTGVVETGGKTDHKWKKVTGKVITSATCVSTGKVEAWDECEYGCGTTKDKREDTLAKIPHTYDDQVRVKNSENVKVENGQLVLDEEGKVQLIKPELPGFYVLEKHCTSEAHKDGGWVEQTKVDVPATTAAGARIKAKSVKGITTDLTSYMSGSHTVTTFPLKEDTIELEDCTEAGSYTVEYLDNDGKAIAEKDITVAPHHYNVSKTAVFKTQSDADQAIISWDDETKTLTVKSNHCTNSIEYTEVTHCNATNCKLESHKLVKDAVELDKNGSKVNKCAGHIIETATKTATPAAPHSIAESIKKDITKYAADHKYDAKLSEIEKRIKGEAKDYVKVEVPSDVCEKGGEVTVKYICKIDKETVVETQKITVVGEGHKTPAVGKIENEVEATCEHGGSYDLVKRCERCEKELSKESKKTPRLAHTNEKAVADKNDRKDTTTTLEFVGDKLVDTDGKYLDKKAWTILAGKGKVKVGDEKGFQIEANVFTNCKECNNHKVQTWDQQVESLKVVDIQKEDSKGQNGYIVLEAVLGVPTKDNWGSNDWKYVTVTSAKIPYYSSMKAYVGRVEDAVLNGLHKDEDGVYRYYVNGELQKDYTGMITDNGEKYLVVKGALATDIDGLWFSDVDKVWYFFVEGHVRADYTGIALYDGEWFYVTNGKLDEGVTGLVPYDGGTFLFTDGRLRNDVNGLWQDINNPEDWYFLALGQVQNLYSGVAQYDGAFFVVKNGKLDTNYNGTIKYDGETFKVVNGQLITK